MENKPKIIDFDKIGEPGIGYISVSEAKNHAPFAVKRVYWTYHTPESVLRGRHAHRETEQVLIALAGRIVVTLETNNKTEIHVLDRPDKGLYVPPNSWHTMQYSHTAVQLVLASHDYDANDYIRDYEEFKSIWKEE